MRDRLFKTAAAIATGQGINVLRQLALPAAFLAFADTDRFAAWLVLSAGLAQLNLLDFGLQTCAINRMGMAFHTGDFATFRRVQSAALWLTLGIVAPAALLVVGVLGLPVEAWLKLALPASEVRWTMLLLAWGILAQIVAGQLVGVFRAINLAWRGQMWGNALRLGSLVVLVVQLALQASFPSLALGALLTPLILLALVLIDLRWRAPECFPSLRHWDRREACDLVRPSLYFSLGVLNNFLLFEVPLLILQRTSGATAVVSFSVLRTLLAAGRQLLTPVQYALIPEITRVFAQREAAAMNRLYRFSVEVAFLGGAVLSLAFGLAAAGILDVWLHRKVTVAPVLVALLAAVSMATASREARYLFQFATNRHERSLVVMTVVYALMLAAGGWLAARFQENGLAFAWLLAEVGIVAWLARENLREFKLRATRALWSSQLLVPVVFALVWAGLEFGAGWNVWLQMGAAGVLASAFGLVLLLADRARHAELIELLRRRLRWLAAGCPRVSTTANSP